jgi:uncharacterized protein (DUF427 family)
MSDRRLKNPALDHTPSRPGKGATYYDVPAGGRSGSPVWTYGALIPALGQIRDYVAFHANRVDEIVGGGT